MTGLETQVARDSGMVLMTRVNGTVTFVSATAIVIRDRQGVIAPTTYEVPALQPGTPASTSARSCARATW